MSGWQIGPVRVKTDQGDYILPGWVSDVFSIDSRYTSGGDQAFIVTHNQTGFIVATLQDKLEDVKFFAERLLEGGDWNFSDPAHCKQYKELVSETVKGMVRARSSNFRFIGAEPVT